MKTILILTCVLVSFSFLSKAQGNFGVQIGVSHLSDQYGSNLIDNIGSSKIGLNIGLKYFIPLRSCKGLSLTLGIDYLNNGLMQTDKERIIQYFEERHFTNVVIKNSPNYVNIPLLVGVDYKLPIVHSIALFGDAALGVDYSTMTDLVMTFDDFNNLPSKSIQSYKPVVRAVCQVGGGVLINNKFTIGVHYNLLVINSYLNVSMLTTELGFRF